MDSMKMKLLDELLSHLADSQGDDMKSSMAMKPMMDGKMGGMMDKPEDPMEKEMPMDDDDMSGKGVSVEKVSLMGKPGFNDKADMAMKAMGKPGDEGMPGMEPDGDEMSEDDLKELLESILSKG